jgi:predicted MFS family arabinose efflux permease
MILYAALLLAAFLVNLDTTLVNVALALVRELHATTTQLQWVVAYNLVSPRCCSPSAACPTGSAKRICGRTGVFGRQPRWWLHATRRSSSRPVSDGLGAARHSRRPALTQRSPERRERARAIGLWGAVAGVAIAMGPIVGGWLLERFSWASIFIAMAPVAAVTAILVALVVPASKDPDAAALDIPGLVLSAAAMAPLVFTIIEAPAYGWEAGRSLAGFAASAVLLAAFIVAERRAAHPMLDVRLFRNMRFSAASGAVTVSFFTLLGFIFLMTQYFQFVRGYGPLSTGVRLLPEALSVGAGSVAGTQLAVRAGTKLIVTIGLVAMAAFYGWVAATTSATISYNIIAAQMVLYGLGMGLSSAPATESIMGAISRRKAGVGSAVNDSTRLIGGTRRGRHRQRLRLRYGSHLTATLPRRARPAPRSPTSPSVPPPPERRRPRPPALGQDCTGGHSAALHRCPRRQTASPRQALLAALFLPAQNASPIVNEAGTADGATNPRQAHPPAARYCGGRPGHRHTQHQKRTSRHDRRSAATAAHRRRKSCPTFNRSWSVTAPSPRPAPTPDWQLCPASRCSWSPA